MSKIMLAEDDNNLREIYEARLQAEGYTIVAAKDGEEALVVAKAEKPDLIIADVMMPKISGFEMLDILRNTDGLKEVKVIMLTALGQSDDQKRADLLGADRYLVKSQVTLEDIVKVAHELLQDGTPPEAPAAETPAPEPTPTPEAAAPAAETTPEIAAVPEAPVESAPELVAATPAPETPMDSPAQSTAQEETAVEGQVESFVAGATEDGAAPVTDDAAAIVPDPAADATPPASDDSTADDKLVSDAVDTFAANTDGTVVPAPEPAPPETEATDTAEEAPAIEAEPATETEAPVEDDGTGSVPIARKKIISPPDAGPKKDLDELLAIEAAKEQASTPPTPVVATNEGGIQTPSPTPPAGPTAQPAATPDTTIAPSDPNDPSNIAL